MFSRIRKRITYANVAMTLALVFAMSGGAYAASKYVITSTKQISPKVLKSLKGAKGANGANGANGAAGLAGPAGPAGPGGPAGAKGESGAAGANGAAGSAGKEGKEGKEGSPWTAGGTLPKGSSETGVWAEPQGVEYVTNQTQFFSVPISFTIRLAAELEESKVHFIAPGATTLPAGCNGSVEKPEAESGNLCVFASVYEHIIAQSFINPEHTSITATAGKTGVLMSFEVPAIEEAAVTARGTWAVTG